LAALIRPELPLHARWVEAHRPGAPTWPVNLQGMLRSRGRF
jgi:hypothetical protein